jgi:hypothetical protein
VRTGNKKTKKEQLDKNNTKLKLEVSDLELSSIVTSLSKSAHDIEEGRHDEKTAFWLRKIGKKLTLQAKRQGVSYPVIKYYQKSL